MEEGKETKVCKENVDEYLKLMTKVLVTERFKEVMESFKKGFEEVVPLSKVTKWVRYDEFWSLTIGIKELTNWKVFLKHLRKVSGCFKFHALFKPWPVFRVKFWVRLKHSDSM